MFKLSEKFKDCFRHEMRFNYLGYTHIPYEPGSECYEFVENFIIYLDRYTRPWFIPRWFLNILHAYGNGNSPHRVTNRKLHQLHAIFTDRIMITDIKTKYGPEDLCLYGYWPDEVEERAQLVIRTVASYYALKYEIETFTENKSK